ncbi:SAM-dependent methyltransferase, partial [Pseudomonas sp. AMR01]|uniref:SAM-dependent methyltransferase n=1 Tax=Pseudomonas sp. AMR01 TaxID=3064904 RepID=UPI0035C03C9D
DVSGELPEDVNMAALADPMATTVVYMGKRTFAGLASRLVDHGLPGDTPALLAEAVSTPAENVQRFTVETLARYLEGASSTTPALIFYGPLAELDA